MNSPLHRSKKTSGGFTLIEILVSFTVLGLIMVGVAQMMNSALSATIGGYKHMDADTQARMVLDRMAYDISKITKRPDVDYFFLKNSGNDQMAFYSESGGYYPSDLTGTTQQSDVALVGYMINSSNQLVRLSKGLCWNAANSTDTAMIFNPSPTSVLNVGANTIPTKWPAVASGTDTNYQVIGDQVFRLEYTFLNQTSPTASQTFPTNLTATIPYYSDSPSATTSPYTAPNGLKDVTAIIVTIAVLDNTSRAILSPTQIQAAASNLADSGFATSPTSPGTKVTTSVSLPYVTWKTKLASNNLGLPQAAASQVRFYQRYCYLNHLQ
jgi:Tfp pilus assembly protein PilV